MSPKEAFFELPKSPGFSHKEAERLRCAGRTRKGRRCYVREILVGMRGVLDQEANWICLFACHWCSKAGKRWRAVEHAIFKSPNLFSAEYVDQFFKGVTLKHGIPKYRSLDDDEGGDIEPIDPQQGTDPW